jgi:molecular chaperone IbpA
VTEAIERLLKAADVLRHAVDESAFDVKNESPEHGALPSKNTQSADNSRFRRAVPIYRYLQTPAPVRAGRKIFCVPLETEKRFANFPVATTAWRPGAGRARARRRAPVVSGAARNHLALMEDLAMRTYDFSPLWRSTVGFDRLFDLAETAQRAGEENYPPYNIERLAEDRYQISLAVAGFAPDDISITAEQNVLTIEGSRAEKAERDFLYRGISTRHFKRQYSLADYVQVKDAAFDNGLLRIELVQEIPEAMKPRRIAINGAADNVQKLEAKAA